MLGFAVRARQKQVRLVVTGVFVGVSPQLMLRPPRAAATEDETNPAKQCDVIHCNVNQCNVLTCKVRRLTHNISLRQRPRP